MSIEARKTIEREWAAHLETCMNPECQTCAGFDVRIYGHTSH